MFKVGDYVVNGVAEAILNTINVLEVIDTSEIAVMCKYVATPKYDGAFGDNRVFINQCDLRPAVLSDWAREIPEKYPHRYCFLAKNDLHYEANHSLYFLSKKEMSSPHDYISKIHFGDFIADALSAHYGIPIMPYEVFQKYLDILK